MFHVSNPVIKYVSLRKLKLKGMCISEKLIKDIVGNCPNIRSLCLGNLRGLKKPDISKLDKLEAVEILASIELLRILCERLLDMKKYPTCCGSFRIKCWRHDLKSARIESLGGVLDRLQLMHWNLLLNKLPSDAKGPVMCFKLEWDDSIHDIRN
ncbi:hypothetical protein TIFTF001_014453 [Ficus carica]|uniref:Uncharacterized protein n=1 Tax=Ficus carica TaxID=3494 RepID=A0AA88A3Y8_FICCA|nr:hypothetical protein TIFTF001_014453 [Ficus carica]